ncbi:eukaryotic translation initiation factor 4E, putative [Plasmodium vinckei]|uniref:Translation initiation factor 4E n=3 Tax=Plasmodium vinckei TaxID=5860 RepID=W7AHW8_PLAVN|nr:eukaryotic translation initiation factor 4E, putative [Plasmodium vinckei vinckei]EUD70858.1 translation initiation factor 4E [Plasmodium vinckei petteri]CAD2097911.1 eukaryotic translation initiation factor 4E, putative [Plasmodium vinckei]KEG01029.1 translation initiation factor 4E [Plasmodium vinckei vinckei]CAD2097598.1 eukaryotic translation initiation factor 4E, putative [Plasmodium vinckei petteri]VEV55042.1 eukaryotic translation initiation factor 4E, putative [Plasmodium vinckei vi
MKYLTFNKSSRDAFDLNEKIEATKIDLSNPLLLQYNWVIWEQVSDNKIKQSNNYKDYTRPLAKFNSVQKFWQLWNRLPQPSDLLAQRSMTRFSDDGIFRIVDALMIFRDNIQPMWEDPANAGGGHFEYKILPKDFPYSQIDEFWNNLVLAIIGCSLKHYDLITGIRLVDKLSTTRYGYIRIEIWYTTITDESVRNHLRKDLEEHMCNRIDGSHVYPPRVKSLSHVHK